MNALRYRLRQWDIRASRALSDRWHQIWAFIANVYDVIADTAERGVHLFSRRMPLIGIALAILVLYLGWQFVWGWANAYVAPSSPEERTSLLTTVAQIAGGIAVAIGVYFTFRSIQVNREGQVTERFTRAIDQMGDDTLEVRLGGLYALERISRDSARDHGPVMEVLTAFIRNRAPVDSQRMEAWQAWEPDVAGSAALPTPSVREQDRVAEDVQAALTVIGRRRQGGDRQEQFPFDFANTDLRFATCFRANLAGAGFLASDLEGAYFANSDLSECPMMFANLRSATFLLTSLRSAVLDFSVAVGSNLTGADLRGASLWGTKFMTATLDGANMWGTLLLGTRFDMASLQGATFTGAQFQSPNFGLARLMNAELSLSKCEGGLFAEANLTKARLFGVEMSGVLFRQAIFQSAVLESSRFNNCDLGGSSFIDADLTNAEFSQSSLAGANFTGANLDATVFADSDLGGAVGLTLEQLATAEIAGTTRLPDYLQHPQPNEPE